MIGDHQGSSGYMGLFAMDLNANAKNPSGHHGPCMEDITPQSYSNPIGKGKEKERKGKKE
jgi:hypothetical protein